MKRRKKKRWLTAERSQIIAFMTIFVAAGFLGGIERGNLPLGGGIILSALTLVFAIVIYILGGQQMTQCERIINYIDTHGSITQKEAQEALGIMRLASRVHDLRRMGYPIEKVTERGKNRWNEPTIYARYKIKG